MLLAPFSSGGDRVTVLREMTIIAVLGVGIPIAASGDTNKGSSAATVLV